MIEAELLEAFPRRPSAFLLAAKWKGKVNSHVLYSGPHEKTGVYEQSMDRAQVGGDMVFVPLGKRIDAAGSFTGCFAPIKDCKLINREDKQ